MGVRWCAAAVTAAGFLLGVGAPACGQGTAAGGTSAAVKLNKGSLRVGDPSPPIELEDLLQAPAGSSVEGALRAGRVVVLEFWATDCGPCIAAFGHINELVEELKDEPVVFVSITSEERGRVERFLSRRPLKTWVGLDTDRSVFRAFAANAIPYTAVIGRDGRVAAFTSPTDLTAPALRRVIAGEPMGLTDRSEQEFVATTAAGAAAGPAAGGAGAGGANAVFGVQVRPAREGAAAQLITWSGGVNAMGYTVRQAIAYAFGVQGEAIESERPLAEARYDFLLSIPSDGQGGAPPAEPRSVMRSTVEHAFGLRCAESVQRRRVLVLRLGEPGPGGEKGHRMRDSQDGQDFVSSPGSVEAAGLPMETLARVIGSRAKMIVVDETGLGERALDWGFRFEPGDVASIVRGVEEGTGLRVSVEERAVRIVEVVAAR